LYKGSFEITLAVLFRCWTGQKARLNFVKENGRGGGEGGE